MANTIAIKGKVYIILLVSVLFINCKLKTENKKENPTSHKHNCPVSYQIMDSFKDEFDNASPYNYRYSTINFDTIPSPLKVRPSIIINTAIQKLSFENINPVIDENYIDEEQINYFNLGFNKELNKYLLYIQEYENSKFMLIDNATAKKDIINGYPYFSPDGTKFLSYNIFATDDEIVYSSEIELGVFCEKELKFILKKELDFIPLKIKWKDDNNVVIKGIKREYYDNANLDEKIVLYKKIFLIEK